MCKFSSKSEGVPFQPLGDLTWNDPYAIRKIYSLTISNSRDNNFHHDCYKLYIIIS